MMDRRTFLRRSAIIAAGVVAADQLELVERLFHVRKSFPSGDLSPDLFKIRPDEFAQSMNYFVSRISENKYQARINASQMARTTGDLLTAPRLS